MKKLYQYIGPQRIRLAVAGSPIGTRIASLRDLEDWIGNAAGLIAATFVVDLNGYLRVADRQERAYCLCCGYARSICGRNIF